MKIDTFKCDICGAMKQESNHWWRITPKGFIIDHGINSYYVESHVSSDEAEESTLDVCSEGCLIKAEAQFREVILKNARQGEAMVDKCISEIKKL